MTPGEDDKLPAAVIEAAAAWFMRLKDEALDAEARARLKAELDAWLAEDEAHRRAWELAQRAWTVAGALPARNNADKAAKTPAGKQGRKATAPLPDPARPLKTPRPAKAQTPAKWIRWATTPKFAIAATVAAMFLLFKFAPQFSVWLRADFQTVTAQTQSLFLDDGSKIIIGAESALTQDFSASRRKLALLRGEAWFEVAPDQARPFIVTAGGMTIRVIGTAFDVAMTGRAIAVALARGSVEIRRPGKTPLQKTLKPGQRLVIDRNSGVVRITKVEPALMGGWRNGQLIVHGARLADVVDTIDRYYPGTITLISQPLAERRVTGVFDLNNPQKALRSLLSPYGASAHKLTPWHTIILGG